MTAPEHAWLTIDGYFVGEPNDAVGRVEYTRADLCIRRDDPALLAVVEALKWYAEPNDIGEAQRSLDGGSRARFALTKITERMGLK